MTPERSRYHQWAYRFNSHPHKEDDRGISSLCKSRSVSTHILTRRMTQEKQDSRIDQIVSTHILTRRMTRSIDLNWWRVMFQLTSSQGGWPATADKKNHITVFQLTSSQGGWPSLRQTFQALRRFNSHPHKEDDCRRCYKRNQESVSTHILTRRMTAILNKNTLSKTARIIPFEYNTLKIYIFSNSYLLFFWKNTPFSGANLPEDFCALIIRTKISKYP